MTLIWIGRTLERLAGRAKHASFEIAETVRANCTHEPLTIAEEAELEEELEAAAEEEESIVESDGGEVSRDDQSPDKSWLSQSRHLAKDRPKETTSEGQAVVWGQYLAGYHHTETQWGIYGTSAALQILAMHAHRRGDDPQEEEQVAGALPLPSTIEAWDKRLDKKVQKGDLQNIVKLAYIAEAHHLGKTDVPNGDEPPIVREIVSLAYNNHYWSSRLPGDRLRINHDHEFPTAVVLYALKRYEYFRRHEMWSRVRPWLARTVTSTDGLRTATMYALTGLALLPDDSEKGSQVQQALSEIDEFLINWAYDQKEIVLSRPVFNGFAIGESHDYLFLHPELLAALYLLERATRSEAQPFVLRAVETLCANVEMHGGAFEGQSRTVSTLDQLWAVRLLEKFVSIYDAGGGPQKLLPTWRLIPSPVKKHLRPKWRRAAIGVLVAGSIIGGGALAVGEIVAAFVAFLFALFFAALPRLFAFIKGQQDG